MGTNGASRQLDTVIDVVTPENIAFEYQTAGPTRRALAYFLDYIFRAVIFISVGMFLLFTSMLPGVAVLGISFYLLMWFTLEWFYGGLFEALWNGQTPGKWILGLRVLTTSGRPINGLQAIARNIFRFVDLMPLVPRIAFAALLGVSLAEPGGWIILIILFSPFPTCACCLITMMSNKRYRRMGDLVCDTMVISEAQNWLWGLPKIDDPKVKVWASELPPLAVGRQLANALSRYVGRRKSFPPQRRAEIAAPLGQALIRQLGLIENTDCDLLLCALYYRTFIEAK